MPGRLLASGPLKGTALRAGFLILKADSLQEAQALIEADPFTREDLICGLSIEQWDPLFGMLAEYFDSAQTLEAERQRAAASDALWR